MSEPVCIWVKEVTGRELANLPGLLSLGYTVYKSAMDDSQGWQVKGVEVSENPFANPSHVLFVEEAHQRMPVGPAEKTRFYIVGWPEPWSRQPSGH